jgi:uncharacterized protein (TIGR02996 family)
VEPAQARELRARIASDPDDLDLRLVYADAIEPVDAERARFIRLQCRAEGGDEELAARRAPEWAAHLSPRVLGWRFIHGFIELVKIDAEAFLGEAARIAAADPVRHWDLAGAAGRLGDIAAQPVLARARSLSLAGNDLADEDIRDLAAGPPLSQLVWLDIGGNPRLSVAALRFLAEGQALPSLQVLQMEGIGARSPLHRPAYDWDGTLVTVDRNPIGEALEVGLGRRILWLYPLADRVAEPADRFLLRPFAD